MLETIKNLEQLNKKIDQTIKFLELDKKREQFLELEKQIDRPGFWDEREQAVKEMEKLSELKGEVEKWENMKKDCQETLELAKMAEHDHNQDLYEEIRQKAKNLVELFAREDFVMMFSGKYDKNNTILSIYAGAGGVESSDWAAMLLRMFLRYAEKQGFKAEIVEKNDHEEAGIKSVTMHIDGRFAYGYLKSEAGVHRLVRMSPFDADHARHTSFALVEVIPEIEKDEEVELDDKDLKIDTFRSSGAGGQSVNKTDSAVRITHIPTGLVATCQSERSQLQNKEHALKILRSRILERKIKEEEGVINEIRGEVVGASWGNQIRSYVLHPYKQVKDHRTNFVSTDPEAVLDGGLDEFIEAYLRNNKK